jgi:hypothetical protein
MHPFIATGRIYPFFAETRNNLPSHCATIIPDAIRAFFYFKPMIYFSSICY